MEDPLPQGFKQLRWQLKGKDRGGPKVRSVLTCTTSGLGFGPLLRYPISCSCRSLRGEHRTARLAFPPAGLQPVVTPAFPRATVPARPRGTQTSRQKVAPAAAGGLRPAPEPCFSLTRTLVCPRGPPRMPSPPLRSPPELVPHATCLYAGEMALPAGSPALPPTALGRWSWAKWSGHRGSGDANKPKRRCVRTTSLLAEAGDANDLIKIQITSAAGRREDWVS